MEVDRQNVLLSEYNGCAEQVGRLDSLIWQTAGVVFPIALAGFAFFGIADKHSWEQFYAMVALGIGSSALVGIWFFLSRTWYIYQSAGYYRMREIESELNMLHYRYSRFLRLSPARRQAELKQMNDTDREHFLGVDRAFPSRPSIGIWKTTGVLTFLFLAGWGALLLREYALLPRP